MLQHLKEGYARLLHVPVEVFGQAGISIMETAAREEPEWANWVLPLWILSIDPTVVCSVAPQYLEVARSLLAQDSGNSLLSPALLDAANELLAPEGWVQREIFYYCAHEPPVLTTAFPVERLRSGDMPAQRLLRRFDGGVFAIRDTSSGSIASYAGIKNKGLIQEVAVGTEPPYQKQGMGKAVVAAAVAAILLQRCVPVYIPDTVTNLASYALCSSLGFEKAGEMMNWEYELPDWEGFPIQG